MPLRVNVESESVIITHEPYHTGAGPLWCYGCTTIARRGDTAYATAVLPDAKVPPLCNTRLHLYRKRADEAWQCVWRAEQVGEREPCPIGLLSEGRIAVSTNPAVKPRGARADGIIDSWCKPQVLLFDESDLSHPTESLEPRWNAPYPCFEHSYRGFATDGASGSLFVTQQVVDGDTHSQAWALRQRDGDWVAAGLLRFPMRGCYPMAQVRGRELHVFAVSDEHEPNEAWAAHKLEVNGKPWDYDFRQLFYTWTPDAATQPFSPVLTVASADETCGHVKHCDLWVDDDGVAHVLYIERNTWHPFVRDRFFPAMPITVKLQYAKLKRGRVIDRQTLLSATERLDAPRDGNMSGPDGMPRLPMDGPVATSAAWHRTPRGELLAVWHQDNPVGTFIAEPGDKATRIELQHFPRGFFVAHGRGGSEPADTLDLYCHTVGDNTIRHAQVRVT